MTDKTCKTCRYWEESQELSLGCCRRRAPNFVEAVSSKPIWPVVVDVDWCGEYEINLPVPPNPGEGMDAGPVVDLSPLNIRFDTAAEGGAVSASFWPPHGRLRVIGVKSFNNPDEVELVRITTGNSELNMIAGPVDSAAYRCGDRRDYWRVDWGTIFQGQPIHVTAKQFVKTAVSFPLRLVVYGELYYETIKGHVPSSNTDRMTYPFGEG